MATIQSPAFWAWGVPGTRGPKATYCRVYEKAASAVKAVGGRLGGRSEVGSDRSTADTGTTCRDAGVARTVEAPATGRCDGPADRAPISPSDGTPNAGAGMTRAFSRGAGPTATRSAGYTQPPRVEPQLPPPKYFAGGLQAILRPMTRRFHPPR